MAKTISRSAVLALILVALAGCDGDPSEDEINGSCTALTETASQLSATGYSGTLGVIRGTEALLWSAHGACIRYPESRCSTDSVFDIGSVTKQFTAAAILALEEEGKISVDNSLAEYFDALPSDKANITLHQLLTHTGGFPESIGSDYSEIDRQAFVSLSMQTPLEEVPGSRYIYSNIGYSILAAIIEIVTDGPYEEYLANRLFKPAGLTHTGYTLPDFSSVTVAHGYLGPFTIGAPNHLPWDADGPWWHLRGNGGILSNLEDMRRWHEALLSDKILSDASKEKMFTPWVDEGDGDTYYGYGWSLVELDGLGTLAAHDGGNDYFYANFLRFIDADMLVITFDNHAFLNSQIDIATDLAEAATDDCP